jgi:hypothetical protein
MSARESPNERHADGDHMTSSSRISSNPFSLHYTIRPVIRSIVIQSVTRSIVLRSAPAEMTCLFYFIYTESESCPVWEPTSCPVWEPSICSHYFHEHYNNDTEDNKR